MVLYWVTGITLGIAATLSLFSFGFSSIGGAGLASQERIRLNGAVNNITIQQQQSQQLLDSTIVLQYAIDNTTDTIEQNVRIDVPTLEQCEESLESFYPILQERVDSLNADLDSVDLTALDQLGPAVDAVEILVENLATAFQYTGVVEVLQQGTFLMGNTANYTFENVNMTYSLRQMRLSGGARLYFLQIPPNPDNLVIRTTDGLSEASVTFFDWYPPLALDAVQVPAQDSILDGQRYKIRVTPTPVIFNQRRYTSQGHITLVDTGRNFTEGDVVRVVETIEMNVGYL